MSGDTRARYRRVRAHTEALCRPLSIEDHVVQPAEWVSPPKWHLAHTTWFFETFLLSPRPKGFRASPPEYAWLFNSYYESLGARAERSRRGAYSRPTVEEVLRYRARVDEAVEELLESGAGGEPGVLGLIELGIHHEQQHQELLLTDIKYILHQNPSRPAYAAGDPAMAARAALRAGRPAWVSREGGLREIGWDGPGFAFDNERPRHRVLFRDYRIQAAPVTNGRFLAFMEDGGYSRPELWLSAGWEAVRREGWRAPLYWEREEGGEWRAYDWNGMGPVDPDRPVCHVSHFEADAFARWSRARLPLEEEWEDSAAGRPLPGAVWEWTASAYLPYPGFRPLEGAAGEYNGKFMMDQMVLRGGSLATPEGHMRATYRNFFPAATRWQFSGFRLAEGP